MPSTDPVEGRREQLAALEDDERTHVHRYGLLMCPDPYCRVCRDEDGEVRGWLEGLWNE